MIKLSNVSKYYLHGKHALDNISFHISEGEFVFLTGHSGAGKSSLLRIIAAMDKACEGQVIVDKQDITNISNKEIPFYRRKIGMVFQDYRLMVNRTVGENVALPLLIKGVDEDDVIIKVDEVLEKVGLKYRRNDYPMFLSTGEQQRVGIARAIISEPSLILADEPTGNMDSKLSLEILKLFNDLNKQGTTVVMATHDLGLINALKHRVMQLQDGRLLNS
ncbi:MAG: cell division ATP-binding protein FtsE [Ruminobacter sp.]|nr:cell division ATP-binding protein FtsE [Ruminobacter sp.]